MKTLGIWGIAGAILFHAWRSKMTKNEFLASISASIASMGTSLTSIATAIANHPSAGDSDFDPDGSLANAAQQLSGLAAQAQTAADALNPATPGGVSDPTLTDGGSDGGVSQTADTGTSQTADTSTSSGTDQSDSGLSGQSLGDAGVASSTDDSSSSTDTGSGTGA